MKNTGCSQSRRCHLACSTGVVAIGLLSSTLSAQINGSWNVDASGFWTTPSNWNSNPAYPGDGGTAAFGSPATAPRTVTLDANITLGGLTFAGENQYTISALPTYQITLGGTHIINVFNGQHEIAAPIIGSVGLIKNGPGTIVLSGNSTYAGTISINAGTIRAANAGALGTPTPDANIMLGTGTVLQLDPGINSSINLGARKIGLASGNTVEMGGSLRVLSGSNLASGDLFIMARAVIDVAAGANLNHSGEIIDNNVSGFNGLSKIGAGTLEVRRFGGGFFAPNGAPQPLTSLNLLGGITRVSTTANFDSSTSRINSLSITNAQLDLKNNRMVIDYVSTSPIDNVRSYLLGSKIISTTPSLRVGYAEATSLFSILPSNWSGQPIDSTSLLLKATLAGDLNLDGSVNFQDLLRIAQKYGQSGVWIDGDVTYDGIVNFNDLLALSQTYGMSMLTSELHSTPEQFATDWRHARASVPEPSAIAWTSLTMILMRRRRSPV